MEYGNKLFETTHGSDEAMELMLELLRMGFDTYADLFKAEHQRTWARRQLFHKTVPHLGDCYTMLLHQKFGGIHRVTLSKNDGLWTTASVYLNDGRIHLSGENRYGTPPLCFEYHAETGKFVPAECRVASDLVLLPREGDAHAS